MQQENVTPVLIAEGPAIVLVEPQLGENIGMVARAMANFGLKELRLVNPRDGWPNEKARAAASRADHVIDGATVHSTLADAIADLQFVYATTARQREMIKPVVGPEEAARHLRSLHVREIRSGILFGRERWGLENDEVAVCDAIVTFPVNPAFASLNIAQAVLLMSYEWLKTADLPLTGGEPIVPASRAEVAGLVDHLVRALEDANYFHLEDKRERMELTLTSIFSRQGLSEPEVRTLRGVVASLERRWMRKGTDGS
jgi:tRNA/rRNA methyltransferase